MAVQKVIFKNKEYEVGVLSDEARQLFGLLKAAGEQINDAKTSAALAETARQVITAKLDSILTDVPSSDVPQS